MQRRLRLSHSLGITLIRVYTLMRLFCTVITIISCVSLSASAVCFRLKFTFIIKRLFISWFILVSKSGVKIGGQDVCGTSGIHKRSQSCLWNISPIVRKLFQNNGKTLFLVLYSLYPKAWDVYPMIWYIYSKLWYVHPKAWDIHLVRGENFFLRRQETTDWFQIGRGVCQGCILSPWLFNLYAEYIMWNAGLDEAHAGIKIAGRNINNFTYAQMIPL